MPVFSGRGVGLGVRAERLTAQMPGFSPQAEEVWERQRQAREQETQRHRSLEALQNDALRRQRNFEHQVSCGHLDPTQIWEGSGGWKSGLFPSPERGVGVRGSEQGLRHLGFLGRKWVLVGYNSRGLDTWVLFQP